MREKVQESISEERLAKVSIGSKIKLRCELSQQHKGNFELESWVEIV